ncbi:unnamed protein product [Alopecurus aequalis]
MTSRPLTQAKMAPTATATMSIMLELRKYLMLMAILAATVTYVAGLNPPGGVWLRSEDGHLTGDQILLLTGTRRYNAFYYSNAAAFMASVVVILLLLLMERSIGRSNKLLVMAALRVVMVLDFFAVLVAYAAGASRGTATTVVASLLVSSVFIYITGYAAYRALFRPRPPESPGDASLNLRLERRRKILLLFCIFASTVTYTAGLNPPGGFWPDGREGNRPGSPVLEDQHHSPRFIAFFVCNTSAFIASLRGIMLLTTIRSKFKDGDGNGRWWYVLYGHVVVALSGLLVAYAFGSCRETHSTVYVFGLVFAVLAYTAVQFVIQRYWWDKLVDLAGQIQRRLSSYWSSLVLRLRSCWSSMCSCLTNPDEQNAVEEDGIGTQTTPVTRAHTAVLLLATLAATITYQAGMNPPGGFWPDSRDGHAGGDPILLTTHAKRHASSAVHRHNALEAAMIIDLLSLVVAYAVGCGRDVNTSVRVIALAGGVLVCVVIHIVFFTLKTARETPELLKKKRKLLLLFAILVVTITYQAGLTPPGGFWLEDDAGHHAAGYAVLSRTYPHRYAAFFYCNAASFVSSVAIIILLVNPHMYELGIMCHALYLCAVSALLGLIGAYAAGSSRSLRTSLSVVALLAGVFVFIVLLLLPLKFLGRCRIFCRGSNDVPPQPQEGDDDEDPQPHEEGKSQHESDSDEEPLPRSHEGGGDDSDEESLPWSQEGGGADTDEEPLQPRSEEGGGDDPDEEPLPRSEEGGGDDSDNNRETAKYTMRKYLMLVSILVASVTYQAGLIPPGGVWPDSIDGHAAGDPVLHDSNEHRYSSFFYSNSVSFLASIVVIFLLQLDEPLFARKDGSPSPTATIRSRPESDEILRVAQSSILLALLFLLIAYASGCSRRWEMLGYVVVLVVAVLLYIGIHVLLSCRDEKPASQVTPLAQEGEHGGGSSHCTDRLCRCKCHEMDGERTREEIEV